MSRGVLISIYIITLLLTILFTSPTTSHYSSPSPPAAPFSESPNEPTSPPAAEWLSAHATYSSSSDDTRDSVDGACGYGDPLRDGYGTTAASLSETLFVRGQICGACFELRCFEEDVPFDRRWCVSGSSIVVTATNFCAPNYGFDAESEGGHCNPPKQHFVIPVEAFEKIAIWKGGNMPVEYRRFIATGLDYRLTPKNKIIFYRQLLDRLRAQDVLPLNHSSSN
ncbi:variant 2, Expansin-A13 [Lathyrus oleraceus]|uniref:Expansin n=1 Tax=Pisum sativum TaxID=3888 RepID=A0A9D4WUX7_PEA|nr:variant 2, Expansin-A13 [Pisum sativum]